jgi:hypothetical protein
VAAILKEKLVQTRHLGHFLSEKFPSQTNSCRDMGKPEVAAILKAIWPNLIIWVIFSEKFPLKANTFRDMGKLAFSGLN